MSLRNNHYNAIQRMFDLRQLQDKHDFDLRKQEVYRCVPELEAFDQQQVSASVNRIKAALNGKTTTDTTVVSPSEADAVRRKLLTEAGFSEDYLTMRYHCSLCKDTGYVGSDKCNCFKSAVIDLLYADSGLKAALDSENFDTFSYEYYANDIVDSLTGLTPLQNAQNAVATAKKFIETFDTRDEKVHNLIICGNTGVGKTFLTNCIARELITAGHTVLYLAAAELIFVLEDYKFKRNTATDPELITERYKAVCECDLLIIDDLGTETVNNFTITQLFNLLNNRQIHQRPTVISTNLTITQIQETYSERIFSRIAYDYDLIRLFGADIRLKKI